MRTASVEECVHSWHVVRNDAGAEGGANYTIESVAQCGNCLLNQSWRLPIKGRLAPELR